MLMDGMGVVFEMTMACLLALACRKRFDNKMISDAAEGLLKDGIRNELLAAFHQFDESFIRMV